MCDPKNWTKEQWEEWMKEKANVFREHIVPDYSKEFQDKDILLWSNLAEALVDVLEHGVVEEEEEETDEEKS